MGICESKTPTHEKKASPSQSKPIKRGHNRQQLKQVGLSIPKQNVDMQTQQKQMDSLMLMQLKQNSIMDKRKKVISQIDSIMYIQLNQTSNMNKTQKVIQQ